MAAPMTDDTLAMDQAIYFINSELGESVDSLKKAKELYMQVKATRDKLEEQLNFASSEAPGKIQTAVSDAETACGKIQMLTVDHEQLCNDITDHLVDVAPLVKKLTTLTNQIKELEKYAKYLECIARIEDLSSDIQSALIVNSVERSVTQFSEMADFVKQLQSSDCKNLAGFAKDTLMFWYKILKDRFSNEFDEVLRTLRWPLIVSTVQPTSIPNVPEAKQRMDILFNQLLHLQLPDGLSSEGQPSLPFLSNLPGWKPLLLPLQLMLQPLRKRFRFHFYGNKQTNSLDKPEWYFTQTLTWIRDHSEFLRSKIQPLLQKAGLGYIDARAEFCRGLVIVVMEKMLTDIREQMYDEHVFSHLVDEALAFEKELRGNYGYPSNQPGCLHVLAQEAPFEKWLSIERKFALEKMDAMLSSETAWQSQYKDITDVDDMKVPECGESFMTLMLTITERYKLLPEPSRRLQFLDLQLELLDDYRIRLLQVKNEQTNDPLGQCFCAILNTVHFITEVLQEWSELVFFVQLQYHRSQQQRGSAASQDSCVATSSLSLETSRQDSSHVTNSRESPSSDASMSEYLDDSKLYSLEGTVFDQMIQWFELTKKEMLKNIVNYVALDVKARSRPYRKDKWLALPSHREYTTLALSSSACEMLLVLKDRLHQVQLLLSKPLFNMFWQAMAEDLNAFLYKDLILANHFNEGGANQLNFDMTRNLFPLFGEYTQRPENYFKDVKEACILLTSNVGTAMILKDVLHRWLHEPSDPNEPKQNPRETLKEMGIFRLSLDDVELVLSLRTDLS